MGDKNAGSTNSNYSLTKVHIVPYYQICNSSMHFSSSFFCEISFWVNFDL